MSKVSIYLTWALLPIVSLQGHLVPSEDNHESHILSENGQLKFEWYSRLGWTYFMQSSQNLVDWDYTGILELGIEEQLTYNLTSPNDRIFLRLQASDIEALDPETDDFDGDGLSNRDELDIGTDPLSNVDNDQNGIPDDVDALWTTVPDSWKQQLIDDSNKAYYDPDIEISTLLAVLPTGDYDGDLVSNLAEFINGTDPVDYFNGSTDSALRVVKAEGENVAPNTFLDPTITVEVTDSQGKNKYNAPVIFTTASGFLGLTAIADPSAILDSSIAVKSGYSGAKIAYYAPNELGAQEIIATLPTGQSITVTVYVVSASAAARLPIQNFRISQYFDDGRRTFSWTSDAVDGERYQIVDKNPDGTFKILFETTYGSPELPFVIGQNTYSITLTHDFQIATP